MAQNISYAARTAVRLELTVGSSKSAGDIEYINNMPVFLLEDSDSSNKAVCEIIGVSLVVSLSVVGEDGSGNTAIAVGERVYKDGAAYNADDANGDMIGYALGAVESGATTSIDVALTGQAVNLLLSGAITGSSATISGALAANSAAITAALTAGSADIGGDITLESDDVLANPSADLVQVQLDTDKEVGFFVGTTDADITGITARNENGTLCYIYPNATGDGITVSTSAP
jgi:hypothetical protein